MERSRRPRQECRLIDGLKKTPTIEGAGEMGG